MKDGRFAAPSPPGAARLLQRGRLQQLGQIKGETELTANIGLAD
jgi:hypothetical protein